MATNNAANYNPTQYNVLVGGASGAIANVAPSSTTGYVLVSNGISSNPSFQSISTSGTLVLISSQTVSSGTSAVIFNSGISSTYETYLLVVSNVKGSVGGNLALQWSTNSGASYVTTGYQTAVNYGAYTIPFSGYANLNVTTYAYVCYSPTSGTGATFVVLQDVTNGGAPKVESNAIASLATPTFNYGMSINNGTANINTVKVYALSGTFSGTFTLFGLLE